MWPTSWKSWEENCCPSSRRASPISWSTWKKAANFSETEKKPGQVFLMEFLEAQPVQIPTKEVGAPAGGEAEETPAEYAEGNVDEERLDLHKKALALQKKEKITYPEALGRITKGGK
jgi:hypothetical protein